MSTMNQGMRSTPELVQRLGESLRGQASTVVDAAVLRLRQELPDYYSVSSQAFQAAGYGALPAVLNAVWTTLENDGRAPEQLPSHLVDEAVNAARSDVPWEVIDRSYAITHETVWHAVLGETSSWQLPRNEQTLVLQRASKFLFRCFDFLTTSAGKLYERERVDWVDRRQKRLLELVSQAIEGLPVPDSDLNYPTTQSHVAVVGWGHDPSGTISAAARALGADLLSVRAAGSSVWAWLGRPSFDNYRKVVSAFTPDTQTFLALGSLELGREGFSESHRQAQAASWLATRQLLQPRGGVIAYPDVALEALGLADEEHARIFVRHVLGELAAPDAKSAKLRQTVGVYCDCGQNSATAAKRLGVAERTVRYRLRAVEEHLSGPLSGSVLQVGLAVRLYDSLRGQATGRFMPRVNTAPNP
jgi:hypothetical protein